MDITKKTKIVVTLGPATCNKEKIKELILAGANMIRINTSHGDLVQHKSTIELVRTVAKDLDVFIPILVDLQGPKIRVGCLCNPINLKIGDKLFFDPKNNDPKNGIIPVDYDGIAKDVNIADKILVDDGKIQFEVVGKNCDVVEVKAIISGELKSRKGINIPGTTASLSAVTKKDVECIKFAVENNADYIALSFVREKKDVELAKKYITDFGGTIPVIAKIEKPQAVENLEGIINTADGVMVARGDLGVEISPEKVPIVQKNIINYANKDKKVVIVATQMLETMIEQPIPTRAEASDVANAIIDGADAIMLSGETSVGNYPIEAVKMMTSIAENIESSSFCPYNIDLGMSDKFEMTPQAIVASAIKLAGDVKAKIILAFTHTGYSTRLMAKLRPQMPIVAVSDLEKTCLKLSLYWNVTCVKQDWDITPNEEFLLNLDNFLTENIKLHDGDRIILTGSLPHLITGRTNFIRVHRIGAIAEKINRRKNEKNN